MAIVINYRLFGAHLCLLIVLLLAPGACAYAQRVSGVSGVSGVSAKLKCDNILFGNDAILTISITRPIHSTKPESGGKNTRTSVPEDSLDTSSLEQDFTIVDTITRVGDLATPLGIKDLTRLTLHLQAKRTGLLVIPPLSLGIQKTKPLKLQVNTEAQFDWQELRAQVRLETELSPEQPYVQEQILYTLRMVHSRRLTRSSLAELNFPGFFSVRLRNPRSSKIERDGKIFQAVEHHYALFAERSGVTHIPGVHLRGDISYPGLTASQSDCRVPLSFTSPAIELQVHEQMPASPAKQWLPAQNIRLQRGSSHADGASLAVGEALVQTFILTASGVNQAQLPVLPELAVKNARLYLEPSEFSEKTTLAGLISEKNQRLIIIPTAAGQLNIPAMIIPWWNVESDELQFAHLPPLSVAVIDNGQFNNVSITTTGNITNSNITTAKTAYIFAFNWQTLLLFGLAAFVAMLLVAYRSMVTPLHHLISRRRLRRNVLRACQKNDAVLAGKALLDWAQSNSAKPQRSIPELNTELLFDNHLDRQLLLDLDKHLYSKNTTTWEGKPISEALETTTIMPAHRPLQQVQKLNSLYPA